MSKLPSLYEKRKSLSNTAFRLQYVTHVLQNEMDEIESALTEEEAKHPNIKVMAEMLKRLSAAQAEIAEVIRLFGEK
jgi:hypothetical protein